MFDGYPLRKYTWKDWLLMLISSSIILQFIVTFGALFISDFEHITDPAIATAAITRISINGSVYGILISLPLTFLAIYWRKIPLINRRGLSKEDSFILRGLKREDWAFLAWYIPVSYVLYIIGNVIMAYLFGATEATNQIAIESMFHYVPVWVMFLLICVVAPIGEELLFRGILLFPGDKTETNWSRVILSAFLFGLIHNPNNLYTLYTYVGMGFIFSYAAMRTKSVEAAIVYHFLNNFLSFVLIISQFG